MAQTDDPNLCVTCIYGAQPFGYYPVECVHGKRIRELWHDVLKCKNYEKTPDAPEEDPWWLHEEGEGETAKIIKITEKE